MQLLPTTVAQEALGNIATAERDFDSAKQFYRAAASGGGAVGQSAMNKLMKLDLEQNPNDYLQTAVGLSNGEVVIQVKNPSPNAVSGLAIQLANKASGQSSTQRMRGTLAAGQTEVIRTGLQWPADRIRELQATVVRASLAG